MCVISVYLEKGGPEPLDPSISAYDIDLHYSLFAVITTIGIWLRIRYLPFLAGYGIQYSSLWWRLFLQLISQVIVSHAATCCYTVQAAQMFVLMSYFNLSYS